MLVLSISPSQSLRIQGSLLIQKFLFHKNPERTQYFFTNTTHVVSVKLHLTQTNTQYKITSGGRNPKYLAFLFNQSKKDKKNTISFQNISKSVPQL